MATNEDPGAYDPRGPTPNYDNDLYAPPYVPAYAYGGEPGRGATPQVRGASQPLGGGRAGLSPARRPPVVWETGERRWGCACAVGSGQRSQCWAVLGGVRIAAPRTPLPFRAL